jgi:hypothetical protein
MPWLPRAAYSPNPLTDTTSDEKGREMSHETAIVVGDRFSEFAKNRNVVKISDLLTALEQTDALVDKNLILAQGVSDAELMELHKLLSQAERNDIAVLEYPSRASSELTHKVAPENIMISVPQPLADGRYGADLIIDDSNEVLADHQTGQHIQGMALIEAARQLWTAVTEMFLMPSGPRCNFVIESVNVSFSQFIFPLRGTMTYELVNKSSNAVETVFDCKIVISQCGTPATEVCGRYRVIDARISAKHEALAARKAIANSIDQSAFALGIHPAVAGTGTTMFEGA